MNKRICVIGKWEGDSLENYELAEKIGALVAENNDILICGGGPGIMEYSCKGAYNKNGITVGFIASDDIEKEGNKYLTIPIPTGMGYSMRSALAIRSSELVVVVGGGNGTLGEISMAYLEGKKILIVSGTGGWADRIKCVLIDGKYLDERRNVEVKYINSIDEIYI